jgi:serine/threonine-protein kinase
VDEALTLLKPVCDAMDVSHRESIVHRDLKPANILLGYRGEGLPAELGAVRVKVADFGIAKLAGEDLGGAATLGWYGSPGYLSAARYAGLAAAPADDIYSLGAIACRMLSGQKPVLLPQQVVAGQTEPGLEQVAPPLRAALARAMAIDPARRPATAGEFYRELAAARWGQQPLPLPAPLPPGQPRPAAWPRMSIAAAVVMVVVLGGWMAWRWASNRPAPATQARGADQNRPIQQPDGSDGGRLRPRADRPARPSRLRWTRRRGVRASQPRAGSRCGRSGRFRPGHLAGRCAGVRPSSPG